MKPIVDILIPTWNNAPQLMGCLASLYRYIEFPYRVHVLNNGMAVDRQGVPFDQFLARTFPDLIGEDALIQVHQMDDNLGWMGALNWAFTHVVDAPLTLSLNDDVVFIPWNRTFLRQMAINFQFDEVGAVGPSSNTVMGSQNFNNHTLPLLYETSLLIGFCCLFRTEALKQITTNGGPWDSTLPGGDDFDMSIRLRQAGYKLLVDRSCYLHHIGFQTGTRVHGTWWNSTDQRLKTDNALIQKHGLKTWFDCGSSSVHLYTPLTQFHDKEGDWIRAQIQEGWHGLDVGVGANKTIETAIGVDRVPAGEIGLSGGRRGIPSQAEIVADMGDLPVDDCSQDYVIARHVLEHALDTVRVLLEWQRVLKRHGVLLIACPDETKTPTIILDSEHVHAFTPDSLTHLVKAVGFTVQQVAQMEPGFTFCLMAEKTER